MDLLTILRLSWKWGKGTYIVSGILTVAMGLLVAFFPDSIPVCIFLKLLSLPVIYYLVRSFLKSGQIYFYINLGLSRLEYLLLPMIVEFIAFILVMIFCGVLAHVLS